MSSFYIENFGCRATQADGAALENQFLRKGMERTRRSRDAEIVVLNTCTVTQGADKDARASIRRLQRENPGCRILVTGCYAQRAPEELAEMPGVTWVVGNSHKHLAAEIATFPSSSGFVPLERLSSNFPPFRKERESMRQPSFDAGSKVIVGDIFAHTELMAAPVFDSVHERTRPNLKVQDGCDNRCSFCVIPSVRGQSRSMPLQRVISEVRALVDAGYREVVISGINLGRWGRDLVVGRSSLVVRKSQPLQSASCPATIAVETGASLRTAHSERRTAITHRPKTNHERLVDLVRALLQETSLEKLRISSVEPMDWSDELIALISSSPRIAKHAHVPLQSASDSVLRRMHRKYRPWHYREKIAKIHAAMPNAAIGADVMVGFPGETEEEFAETRMMVEELPFTYLHVFTYSARPGTPAAMHRNQVPAAVAKRRNEMLRNIVAEKKAKFVRSQVGNILEAITLRSEGGEFTEALTDNYLKLRVPGNLEANRWIEVAIERSDGEVLWGRPAEPHQ